MPAFLRHFVGKLCKMFLIRTSLSWYGSANTDISLNQLIQFYSNNATNLHHLTTHGTTALPHKMAIVLRPQICDVISPYVRWDNNTKGSDTLESFLSKVAFERDFRKKSCTCVMKTFAIFLLSKETFTIRTCSILASLFRKLLSKATFERKLSTVSLA